MKPLKICLAILVFIVLSSFQISAQSHQHGDHSKVETKKDAERVENIIREEEPIDLKAIDKNKDGKVFQDMMDWNVISDKPAKCPLCKMVLKEVTLEEAKKNLEKHDFKVK
ncbi:hypothetical protein C0389_09045 [bacterium]|nr:hypothetical protein [bacterium]